MLVQLRLFAAVMVVFVVPLANCRAEVYVFGVSLFETGNFHLATGGTQPPSPLHFEGRFSNGQAWVEHIAKAVHEPVPLPSWLGGTNFAFNGARAAGASPYLIPALTEQVASYLSRRAGPPIPTTFS